MGGCLGCPRVPREITSEDNNSASDPEREETGSRAMGQSFPKHKSLPRSEIRRLQRYVSFREKEIQEWYQEFRNSINHRSRHNHDFSLTQAEFSNIYNSVYPGQSAEFAGHIFRTFDRNRDNRVDFQEFLIGLSCNGSDDIEKRLAWAFQVYDVKRTGYITLENMTQIIRAVFKMMGRQVLRHNDDMITAESMAEEMFGQMDNNGHRRISWLQFREGVLRNPTALQILQCSPPDSEPEVPEEDDCAFCRG